MFKVKRVRKKCLACRQGLSDVQILCDDISPTEVELLKDMVLLHCLRCAREKAGLVVTVEKPHAFNNGTGGEWRVTREAKTH
jgi:uncharacterized UPF0146 family protein